MEGLFHLQSDLEYRSTEERIIVGRIVPFGETINVRGRPESFDRNSFSSIDVNSVRLLAFHDQKAPVGRAIKIEAREDGLWAEFRVAETPRGDELLALAKEGLLAFSIGFEPKRQARDGRMLNARLVEVSLVTFGAYKGAQIAEVREEESIHEVSMNENTPQAEVVETFDPAPLEARMAELADNITRLEAAVATPAPTSDSGPSSFEWFQSRLTPEARAAFDQKYQIRDLAEITGTYGGSGDASGLVQDEYRPDQLVNVLDARKPLFSAFGQVRMPQSGILRIPVVSQHTAVGKRDTQFGEATTQALKVTTAVHEAQWFSGAVNMPLELLATAEPELQAMVWSDLQGQYSKALESYAAGLINVYDIGQATGASLRVDSYSNFIEDVATQAEYVRDATDAPATDLAVTPAQWIALLKMTDTNGRGIFRDGPYSDGSMSITGESFGLTGGIRVFKAPKLTVGAALFNREAIKASDGGIQRVEAINVAEMARAAGVLGRAIVVNRIPAGLRIFGAGV